MRSTPVTSEIEQTLTTLIYPGCGYDEELIGLHLNYDRIIAYDTLPKYPHYKPGQPGWEHTATPELFFAKLKQEYGDFVEISDTELFFPKHKMTYFHSTNCHHVEVPEGDIFVRGYLCESWIPIFRKRKVIVSCDTWKGTLDENNIDYKIIHTCDGDCHLYDDWDSDEHPDSYEDWDSDEHSDSDELNKNINL